LLLLLLLLLLLQEWEKMRRVCGGDDVCVSEKEAISYPAEGLTHQGEGDEEVATLGRWEREAPCFLEDLVTKLHWKGGRATGFVYNHGEGFGRERGRRGERGEKPGPLSPPNHLVLFK
jgi:hypothetical protein